VSDDVLPEQPLARAQRRGLLVALAALDEAVQAPMEGQKRWQAEVLAALEGVRAALVRHAQFTEAPDGLFAEVVEHAPRLANAVKHLHAEHDELSRQIDVCEAAVRALGPDDSVEGVAADAADLRRWFDRHRDRGAELVYDAYNVDISEAD